MICLVCFCVGVVWNSISTSSIACPSVYPIPIPTVPHTHSTLYPIPTVPHTHSTHIRLSSYPLYSIPHIHCTLHHTPYPIPTVLMPFPSTPLPCGGVCIGLHWGPPPHSSIRQGAQHSSIRQGAQGKGESSCYLL